jgi:hypothetical protein
MPSTLPPLDLPWTLPLDGLVDAVEQQLLEHGLVAERDVPLDTSFGEATIPLLCRGGDRAWALYIEPSRWDEEAMRRFGAWLSLLRVSRSYNQVAIEICSPEPPPRAVRALLGESGGVAAEPDRVRVSVILAGTVVTLLIHFSILTRGVRVLEQIPAAQFLEHAQGTFLWTFCLLGLVVGLVSPGRPVVEAPLAAGLTALVSTSLLTSLLEVGLGPVAITTLYGVLVAGLGAVGGQAARRALSRVRGSVRRSRAQG